MKTKNIIFRCLFLTMLIVSFAACASTSKQEGTGDYIDDSVITTKIKSQLAADDFLKSFQISVESRKGIAQLSGFVDSQKAVDKAGQIARGVEGVKSVRNDLIVEIGAGYSFPERAWRPLWRMEIPPQTFIWISGNAGWVRGSRS